MPEGSRERPLILRALANEVTSRPPVWFMRQAGRFLPEYQEIRSRVSFLELCADPELSAEVTLQPLRRFAFDAGIVFSDILLPLDAMGAKLVFEKGRGPVFPEPVRDRAGIAALSDFDPQRDLPAPLETLRILRDRSPVPVLGFAGAPFTLACYLIEGGGSRTWHHTKSLMWSDPDAFRALLDHLADAVGAHLQAQIDAGAAAVQLFDTWSGALSPDDYRRWALPAARRALSGVRGAPTIYFSRDSAAFLPHLSETGADVIGIDWRLDMARARRALGSRVIQGNLDPVLLHAPAHIIRERVHAIIQAAGPRGHIFNLGHGIIPTTPIDGVKAAIDAVRSWAWPTTPPV